MHALYPLHIHAARAAVHGAAANGDSAMVTAIAVLEVLLVAFGIALFVAWRSPQPGRSDDDDVDSGGGGGGRGGPPGPGGHPHQPDGGPVWWSEFERQFAAHVEDARRAEPVVVTARAD